MRLGGSMAIRALVLAQNLKKGRLLYLEARAA